MPDYFVHPSSVVDEGARIGAGTRIWHFSHVMPGATIGSHCNNVKIQNNVSLYTGVVVEDDVFLGPSMVFTNVINPRSHVERKNEYKPTIVRRGTSIGANATIVCGVTLGAYSFVGAGAVVTRDVADFTLVHGNPARARGYVCQCGTALAFAVEQDRSRCSACGAEYARHAGAVQLAHK